MMQTTEGLSQQRGMHNQQHEASTKNTLVGDQGRATVEQFGEQQQ